MNPKEPVWHFLKQVAAKLGFTRTMTAPGSDVVDAVNRQSDQKANKDDLTNIARTGATNTGTVITAGTYFYLDNVLVRALSNISNGATFTSGTNYETVPGGGLNEIKPIQISATLTSNITRGEVFCYKIGAIVIVTMNVINDNNDIPADSVIVENLPPPIRGFYPIASSRDQSNTYVDGGYVSTQGTMKTIDYAWKMGKWYKSIFTYVTNS